MWLDFLKTCLFLQAFMIQVIQAKRCTLIDEQCELKDVSNEWMEESTEDCRVLLGSLTIKNMSIQNQQFANIREITGYLEVINVTFYSLSELLPKLSVIRGEGAKDNFSLTIIDNPHLNRIGLNKLRHIGNGNVKIQNNPNLCFAEKVNWSLIASDGLPENNVIETEANCAKCVDSEFCWDADTPQKICHSSCSTESCTNNGTCCDSECLGGCSEDNLNKCISCKHFLYDDSCHATCPEKTLMYLDKYCVTVDHCRSGRSFVETSFGYMYPSWRFDLSTHIVINNTCLTDCPLGYTELTDENKLTRTCEPDGFGKHVCSDIKIRNLIDLNSYVGLRSCQLINGSIDIMLTALTDESQSLPHFKQDDKDKTCFYENFNYLKLIEIFGAVEEIRDYLRINQSPFLRDLSLFPKLKRIKGENLFDKKYALVLTQNKNLRNTWKADQKVVTDRGESQIGDSEKNVILSRQQNNTIIVQIISYVTLAIINWTLPQGFSEMESKNYLYTLSYDIYRSKSTHHSCRKIISEKFITQATSTLNLFLPNKPSLRYYLFELQLLNQENKTVASSFPRKIEIKYSEFIGFVTFLTTPDPPGILVNLTHEDFVNHTYNRFELSIFRIPYNMSLNTNSYCESRDSASERNYYYLPSDDRSYEKSFELMDKKTKEMFFKELMNEPTDERYNLKDNGRNVLKAKVDKVFSSYVFKNLDYSTFYLIIVKVCSGEGSTTWCSDPQVGVRITPQLRGLSTIDSVTAVSNEPETLEVSWLSPNQTNGPILFYEVVLMLEGSTNNIEKCISQQEFVENKKLTFLKLIPGNYSVSVTVTSTGEKSEPSRAVVLVKAKDQDSTFSISVWTLSSILVVLLILLIVFVFYARKKKPHLNQAEINLNLEKLIHKPVKDFELKLENLELILELGSGNFGVVYKGKLRTVVGETQSYLDVAVKTTNSNASLEDCQMLLNEAKAMKSFNTKHIVKFLGIVTIDQTYLLVLELMDNKDLKTFLIKNQPSPSCVSDYKPLHSVTNLPTVVQMAIQIADGMAYLTYKRFVHRDLAARNCMVAEDLTVKIGDFGMTRDIYCSDYYRVGYNKALPIRWMAPESLNKRIFTSESDVFSYGIVLWEIVTFADQPYKEKSDEDVIEFIIEGGAMTRPEQNCSDKIYELMMKCWKFDPQERITFIEIIEELLDEAPESFSEDSFYALKNDP